MTNKRVHAVLRLKNLALDTFATMRTTAQYAIDNFTKGGNPEATQIEDFLGHGQTPVFGGIFTTEIDVEFGQILEMIQETDLVELVRVEWPFDEAGEPIVYEPITYEVEHEDENGVVTTRNQPIGRISN